MANAKNMQVPTRFKPSVVQPEPVVAPEPVVQPEPVVAPESVVEPEPVVEPEFYFGPVQPGVWKRLALKLRTAAGMPVEALDNALHAALAPSEAAPAGRAAKAFHDNSKKLVVGHLLAGAASGVVGGLLGPPGIVVSMAAMAVGQVMGLTTAMSVAHVVALERELQRGEKKE